MRSRVLLAVGVLLTACGPAAERGADMSGAIAVTSSAFAADSAIPATYTCKGRNVSPPLAWTGVPDGAAELALVLDDPDAPRGTFVHWVVFGVPPSTASLATGAIPTGAKQAVNSAGKPGYSGPCPPSGTHHYRFTVYALDATLGLADGAGTEEALGEIERHALASGRLVGLVSAS